MDPTTVQLKRLETLWPHPRWNQARRDEYREPLRRFSAETLRRAIDEVRDGWASDWVPPVATLVRGCEIAARELQGAPTGPQDEGEGCPRCRAEGIRGEWIQAHTQGLGDRTPQPTIVHCQTHNLGWQGRLPDADPGEPMTLEEYAERFGTEGLGDVLTTALAKRRDWRAELAERMSP